MRMDDIVELALVRMIPAVLDQRRLNWRFFSGDVQLKKTESHVPHHSLPALR